MGFRLLHPLKQAAGAARFSQVRALGFQMSGVQEPAKTLQNEAHKQSSSYIAPPLIDDVFSSAYDILKEESATIYDSIQKQDTIPADQKEHLQIQAEKHNPEVLYNFRYNRAQIDATKPVYRHLMQREWEQHDLMVTMQRLEQLHVIPDTLATLEPRAHVQVEFAHNTEAEFSGPVAPGTRLPAFAAAKPPTIKVQEFKSAQFSGLYSMVIVNPDVPDLKTNSFKTHLNYGLYNVPLTFSENEVSPMSLVAHPERVFMQYRPMVPEKNAPTQRACVWVFRQEQPLSELAFKADDFDIRAFADAHGLDAVGAHVWRQDYDRSTSGIRAQYGLGPGTVYHKTRGTAPL